MNNGLLSVVALTTFVVLCCSPQASADPAKYQLQTYYQTSHNKSVTRRAEIGFLNNIQQSFRSSGYVKAILVDVGDKVAQGEVLATLDTEEIDYQTQAIQSQLSLAKKEQGRISDLYRQGLVAKASLDRIEADVEQLNEQLKQQTYLLKKANLIAEADGVISARLVNRGELVSSGQTVIALAPVHKNTIIKMYLSEYEIAGLKIGDTLAAKVIRTAAELQGKVLRIAVLPDRSGRYRVDLSIDDKLRAGTDVNVEVPLQSAQVIAVSHHTPVKIEKNTAYVLEQQGGQFTTRALPIFAMDDEHLYLTTEQSQLSLVSNGWVVR